MMDKEKAIEVLERVASCEDLVNYLQDYAVSIQDALLMAIKGLKQESCEDAVSRAEVLSVIHNHGFDNVRSSKISALLKTMRGEVERMPSVLPEYDLDDYSSKLWQNAYERGNAEQKTWRWIPCSERLPEVHKDVLIYLSSDEICIGCYNSHRLPFSNNVIGWGAGYTHNWCSNDVIAWMPLPKPYEPQESEVRDADSN